MWKKRLAPIFVILLLLQSVATMADIHASHQSGIQHLTFDDDHHDASSPTDDILKKVDSKTKFDCHHCCHCHGIHHYWIVMSMPLLPPVIEKQNFLSQRYILPSSPLDLRLRPPISA